MYPTNYPTLPWDDSPSSDLTSTASMAEKAEVETEEEIKAEEINVVNDTIKISGKEAENYKEVLEKLGYSTALAEFSIDSRGDSPELRKELGEDYLDNRVIIVSEEQVRNIYSISDMPSYVYKTVSKISGDLVRVITPLEALVGNIDLVYNGHSIVSIFDPSFEKLSSSKKGSCSLKGLHASLVLDTLTDSVRRMESLNNKVSFITPDSLKGLDLGMVEDILAKIHPLTTRYGSIEHIKDLDTAVSFELSEDITYFSHKGYDIFFFDGAEPFIVYNGKKNIKAQLPVKVLHSSQKSKIIDLLISNQFLEIPRDSLSDRLEAIAKSALEVEVPEFSGQKGFYFQWLFRRHRDKPEIVERLKNEDWYLLRDVCFGNVDFDRLPLGLKESVTRPKDKNTGDYLELLEEKASGD